MKNFKRISVLTAFTLATLSMAPAVAAQDSYAQFEPAYSDIMGRNSLASSVAVQWRVTLSDQSNDWRQASTLSLGIAHEHNGFRNYGADLLSLSFNDQSKWSYEMLGFNLNNDPENEGFSMLNVGVVAAFIIVAVAVTSESSGDGGINDLIPEDPN